MKGVFLILAAALAAGSVWTFVRPLWQEGHPWLALVTGVFLGALFGGLAYFLLA